MRFNVLLKNIFNFHGKVFKFCSEVRSAENEDEKRNKYFDGISEITLTVVCCESVSSTRSLEMFAGPRASGDCRPGRRRRRR